ncbi:MAG: ribonuclease HI [Alphaproteobacteria bacterium]|nr:ribonuclease HI [Alphaproteobacteria bacterium]
MSENKLYLYTDGACSGNPGPGGWACLLKYKEHTKEISGGAKETTNNQMELTAVIEGLSLLKKPCEIELFTDSKYVLEGATKWLEGWIQKGWKKADKKPVLNRDLWEKLIPLFEKHTITWHWVKGHAGHPENERVDAMACQQRDIFAS